MKHRLLLGLSLPVVAAVVVTAGAALPPSGPSLTNVPSANTRSTGYAPPNALSPELTESVVAQGSMQVENANPATVSYCGYDNDQLNEQGRRTSRRRASTTPRSCRETR